MNKKFIVIIVFIAAVILFFSFALKSFTSARSARIVSALDLQNRNSLLALAKSYKEKGDYKRAKHAFSEFIKKFPGSKDAKKSQKEIEDLNIKVLFSDVTTGDSFMYEIKPGDTLDAIALRYSTTVELIKKANGLKTETIFPGKFLKINKTKFNILVDKSENTLTLKNSDGEIIKTYSVSTGENLNTPVGIFKIEEKLISPPWYKDGAVVSPDSPEYELGTRWMGISAEGYGIHGTKDDSSIGQHITKGCVRMMNKEVEELYAIVPGGTEVIIVE